MGNKIYAPVVEFKVTEGTSLIIDEVLNDIGDIAVTKIEANEMSVALDSPTPLPDTVELGAITTVKYLLISSDQNIVVTLNGSIAIPVQKVLFLHTSVTAITITNAGAAVATVKVRLAGV